MNGEGGTDGVGGATGVPRGGVGGGLGLGEGGGVGGGDEHVYSMFSLNKWPMGSQPPCFSPEAMM